MTEKSLSEYTLDELYTRIDALRDEVTRRENEQKEKALTEIRAIAEKYGLSLHDLGGVKPERKTRVVKPIYRYTDPVDQKVHEWSGRGKAPKKFAELKQRGLIDQYRIKE